MKTIRPLRDHIHVAVDPVVQEQNGIVLGYGQIERPDVLWGEVVAVGEGRRLKNGERAPSELKVGDRVCFTKEMGRDVPDINEQREVIMLREDQVLGVGE